MIEQDKVLERLRNGEKLTALISCVRYAYFFPNGDSCPQEVVEQLLRDGTAETCGLDLAKFIVRATFQ